jgi:hypothetical protein
LGIELATFRLRAQCLNQLRHHVSSIQDISTVLMVFFSLRKQLQEWCLGYTAATCLLLITWSIVLTFDPASLRRYVLDGSRFESWYGQKIFSPPKRLYQLWCIPSFILVGSSGLFPVGKATGLMLTSHLRLTPSLRILFRGKDKQHVTFLSSIPRVNVTVVK